MQATAPAAAAVFAWAVLAGAILSAQLPLTHCAAAAGTRTIPIASALLEDLLPASSTACAGSEGFTHNTTWAPPESAWDTGASAHEREVFLAELAHADADANLTWKLRVGTGGNIYSYRSKYGEAVPPQAHPDGYFVDEVWQTVAIDNNLHSTAEPDKAGYYFIHQAGACQNTEPLRKKPFFSPSVGAHCSGSQCGFVSWGQHAHVPTRFRSSVLCFNRYKDCGGGVLEVTTAVHNGADPAVDPSVPNLLSLPWAGVRPSVLKHAAFPKRPSATTSDGVTMDWPGSPGRGAIPSWAGAVVRETNSFGGYTTFAENLPSKGAAGAPFPAPCGTGIRPWSMLDCKAFGVSELSLARGAGACYHDSRLSIQAGKWIARCPLTAATLLIKAGCHDCDLDLISSSGGKVEVSGVYWWNFKGTILLYPKSKSVAAVNAVLKPGDTIAIHTASGDSGEPGKSTADNLALSFVHGTDAHRKVADDIHGDKMWSYHPSSVQVGSHAKAERDMTVFNRNVFAEVRAGNSLWDRQYVVTGRYDDHGTQAKPWVGRATQGMVWPGTALGRAVDVHSTDAAVFTAAPT